MFKAQPFLIKYQKKIEHFCCRRLRAIIPEPGVPRDHVWSPKCQPSRPAMEKDRKESLAGMARYRIPALLQGAARNFDIYKKRTRGRGWDLDNWWRWTMLLT